MLINLALRYNRPRILLRDLVTLYTIQLHSLALTARVSTVLSFSVNTQLISYITYLDTLNYCVVQLCSLHEPAR